MKPTDDDPGADIVPANRKARIAAAALFIVAIPVAIAMSSWLGEPMQLDPPDDVRAAQARVELLLTIITAMGLPMVIGAGFMCRSALRTFASGRFPPPGMWVLVDTPIVTGAKARRKGRLLILLAVLMVAVVIAIPVMLWSVAASFL
ncbi:MAG: hypothetical protein Tsb0020_52250 [Haliangiales bacterium]